MRITLSEQNLKLLSSNSGRNREPTDEAEETKTESDEIKKKEEAPVEVTTKDVPVEESEETKTETEEIKKEEEAPVVVEEESKAEEVVEEAKKVEEEETKTEETPAVVEEEKKAETEEENPTEAAAIEVAAAAPLEK